MRDLTKLSAVDAAKQTRAGAISAAELVEAALERIAALDGRLKAFMTIDEAGARRTAERLDAFPASQRGPLHGSPSLSRILSPLPVSKQHTVRSFTPMTRRRQMSFTLLARWRLAAY